MSTYTNEQLEFINFSGPESIILSAVAGSGKTHSAVGRLRKMLADGINPKKIIFFSFTNDAVDELKARIQNDEVRVTTIHSYTSSQLARMGKFKPIATFYEFAKWYKENFKPKPYENIKKKMEFQKTIESFYEEGAQISSSFSAYKLQNEDSIKVPRPKYYDEYVQFLKDTKSRDFSDLLVETERLSKNPDYVHYFEGTYDYVLIDEYQDTSTLQLKILLNVKAKQYYLIGDRNQCLTKGSQILTSGGYKVIEDLKVGDLVATAAGSGQIVYTDVDNIQQHKYEGPLVELKTKGGRIITTSPKHTHFSQFSFDNENKYLVYLMYKNGVGYRIGKTEIYPKRNSRNNADRFGFKFRLNQEHADKLWVLDSWQELSDALVAEDVYSLRYGIPKSVFVARPGQNQGAINQLFDIINTEDRAKKLLKDLHYSIHQPHFVPKSKKGGLTNVIVDLCSDGRGATSIHTLQVNGYDDSTKEFFEANGYKTTDNGKGTGWRIRKQTNNMSTLMNAVSMISDSVNLVLRAKLNHRTYLQLPASQVVPGMNVMVYENDKIVEDEVVERNIITGETILYDIDVECTHNLVVNDVFTHNSIYGFSGANCDAIETLLKKHKTVKTFNLTTNFRSDKAIVAHSNEFSELKAIPFSQEQGLVEKNMIDEVALMQMIRDPEPLAILVRTNNVIKELEKECLKQRVPMRYFNFITRQDIEYIKKGNMNDSIRKKLEQVVPYHSCSVQNPGKLLDFIEQHQNSNVFITSIHKSKGREYPRVIVVNSFSPEQLLDTPELIPDYSFINERGDIDIEAKNIHYVATSRPKKEIYFHLYEI